MVGREGLGLGMVGNQILILSNLLCLVAKLTYEAFCTKSSFNLQARCWQTCTDLKLPSTTTRNNKNL